MLMHKIIFIIRVSEMFDFDLHVLIREGMHYIRVYYRRDIESERLGRRRKHLIHVRSLAVK